MWLVTLLKPSTSMKKRKKTKAIWHIRMFLQVTSLCWHLFLDELHVVNTTKKRRTKEITEASELLLRETTAPAPSAVNAVDATLRKHFECDSRITRWCLYIFHNAVPSRTDFCVSYSYSMKNQPFKSIRIRWRSCWSALLARDNGMVRCSGGITRRN